jgi:hypothetical protein
MKKLIKLIVDHITKKITWIINLDYYKK